MYFVINVPQYLNHFEEFGKTFPKEDEVYDFQKNKFKSFEKTAKTQINDIRYLYLQLNCDIAKVNRSSYTEIIFCLDRSVLLGVFLPIR